jgi:hypothetical protein
MLKRSALLASHFDTTPNEVPVELIKKMTYQGPQLACSHLVS